MRKYAVYVLAVIFMLMQLPPAYARNTACAVQSGTRVKLSGRLDVTLENELISCIVRNKDGKYYYMDFARSENGKFSFDMQLSADNETEELTAVLSSEYMNAPFEYTFMYRGSNELEKLLSSLNAAADAAEYGKILTDIYSGDMTNMEYLNLDPQRLAKLKAPYDNIYAYIRSRGPYSAENFSIMQTYYLRSAELEEINQADADGVKAAMLEKGAELGAVEKDSVTEKLMSVHIAPEYTDSVYDKMTQINIADEAGLKYAYDVSAALTALEHPVNGRFDASYVIESCSTTLGISQEAERFYKLSQTKQTAVLTAVAGNAYTAESFKAEFARLVAEQESKKETDSSAGSGTGSVGRPNIQTVIPENSGMQQNEPVQRQGFSDIEDVPWAAEAIESLRAKGIVSGRTDSEFDPHSVVTREELVKLLVLAADMEIHDGELPFEDVRQGSWYGKYIRTALDAGIVRGISSTAFGTGAPVTRQDLAVMVYRMTGEREDGRSGGADFADAGEIAQYAAEAVRYLSANGIVNGKENGNFDPEGIATRAETAVIIYRAAGFMRADGSSAQSTGLLQERAELLDGLGFLDAEYKNRTALTRGEFIKIAVRLFGYTPQKIDRFSDVDKESEYYEAVGTAAAYGLISDKGEYFYPDAAMTWSDAVKIFIAGMGYAPAAERGTDEYKHAAAELGIAQYDGSAEPVSYDRLAEVLYRLLDTEICEAVYSDNGISYKNGGTLLQAVHRIYKVSGRVTETGISGLYGASTIGENEITFRTADGELRVNMKNSAEYLGHKAELYFRENEDKEKNAVYIRLKDDGATVIQGEDIDSCDGSVIKYSEGGRSKSVTLSRDAAIIYNGAAVTSAEELDREWYKPENGTVTVLKGDGICSDVVIVSAYECVVFSAYTEKDNTVTLYDRYGGAGYTCEKERIVFYDKNGSEIALSGLSEYDVISVCAPKQVNDRMKVRAYVSNSGITGTITALNIDDSEVTLEAERFKMTENLTRYIKAGNAPSFTPGQSGKFYEDYFGKLAAFDIGAASESDNLAYLINITVDENELGECAAMRILTADNKIKIYKTGEKTKLNGKAVRYNELYKAFVTDGAVNQQLILIGLDEEDTVRSVYTAVEKGSAGKLVKTYTPRSASEMLYYKSTAYGLGGKMIIGISATKVFVVPNEKTLAIATDEDYSAVNRDYFIDGASYRIQGYSVSEENVLEDAVVVYADAGAENVKITDGSTLGLVDEVYRSVNDDGEAENAVVMMYGGSLQTFYAGDDVDISNIRSGDAVQIKLNTESKIQKIRKVFDYQTGEVLMGNTYGSFLDALHLLYGPCINIKDNAIEQEGVYSNGITDTEKFLIQGNCYVYDSSLRGTHVRVGSYTEIQSQRLAYGGAAMILSRRNGGTLREYIIYK